MAAGAPLAARPRVPGGAPPPRAGLLRRGREPESARRRVVLVAVPGDAPEQAHPGRPPAAAVEPAVPVARSR